MWICEFQHHSVSEYTSSQFYYVCLKIILVNLCLFMMGSWTIQFSSVQLLSCVWLFVTPWTTARQASLSITNSWSLLRFMSSESMMPSNHLILCCPLSSCLQSFPASGSFSMSQFSSEGWRDFSRIILNQKELRPCLPGTLHPERKASSIQLLYYDPPTKGGAKYW